MTSVGRTVGENAQIGNNNDADEMPRLVKMIRHSWDDTNDIAGEIRGHCRAAAHKEPEKIPEIRPRGIFLALMLC